MNNNIADAPDVYKNFTGIIDFENEEGNKISGIVENADFKLHEKSWYPPISWYNGTWKNGTWNNGYWSNGIWKNGKWNDGVWNNGKWEKGIWLDGIWNNGKWENGEWITGDDKYRKKHKVNPNEW